MVNRVNQRSDQIQVLLPLRNDAWTLFAFETVPFLYLDIVDLFAYDTFHRRSLYSPD